MADDPVTTADDGSEAEHIASIGELRARQDRQEGMLQAILDKLSGSKAPDSGEGKPGMSLAEEVRAQLEARDASEKERAGKESDRQRVADLEAKIAEMGEKTPEAPIRKVERLMGWR